MIIPDKLKVGGYTYQIIKEDTLDFISSDNLGMHDGTKLKIWISNKIAQGQQETIFIHEILEAINFNDALRLTHRQIVSLSYNLHQVLKDNSLLKE